MSKKDSKQNMLLSEKNLIPGVVLLLFLVFLFSRQFFPSFKDVFSDPFYFLAVITVGIAVAAPAVWILNEGKRVFLKKEDGLIESDLFLTLRSLPENFYSFQNLKIDDEKIDAVVVGLKTVSVIEIVDFNSKIIKNKWNVSNNTIERKIKKIRDYLGEPVQINFLFVLKNNYKVKKYLQTDVLEPKKLKDVLVKNDKESNILVLSNVEEKLENLWKKNLL